MTATVTVAKAEEGAGFHALAEVDALSSFVWRTIPQGKKFAPQATFEASYAGFTPGFYANYSTEDSLKNNISEVDYYLGYETKKHDFTISPLFNFYTYPHTTNPNYPELGGRVSYELKAIKVFTSHYLSFGPPATNGGYFADLGAGYSVDLLPKWKLDSSLTFSFSSPTFNTFNYGPTAKIWALNGVALEIQAPYEVTKSFYWKPHLLFTSILNTALRNALSSGPSAINRPNNAVAGLAAGFKF